MSALPNDETAPISMTFRFPSARSGLSQSEENAYRLRWTFSYSGSVCHSLLTGHLLDESVPERVEPVPRRQEAVAESVGPARLSHRTFLRDDLDEYLRAVGGGERRLGNN